MYLSYPPAASALNGLIGTGDLRLGWCAQCHAKVPIALRRDLDTRVGYQPLGTARRQTRVLLAGRRGRRGLYVSDPESECRVHSAAIGTESLLY